MGDEPNILPFQPATLHSPTQVLATKHRVVHYNAGLPHDLLNALEQDPNDVFSAGRLLRATSTRAAALLRWNAQCYIVKHYYQRSWRSSIKQTIKGTEALCTYNLGCVLADAGIRTPRPVACVNNYRRGKSDDSFLLYPFIEGRMLRSAINQKQLSDDEIERIRVKLTRLWQQLSQLRVGLWDANAGNFIITPNRAVWLIDLDGSRIHSNPITARWRLHLSWLQVNRSIRRAVRERGRPCAEVRRTAKLLDKAA